MQESSITAGRERAPRNGRAPFVLLVEGRERTAWTTARALAASRPGVSVELARSGREALARVRRAPRPDVVVIDLDLADADGLEVAERIAGAPELEGLATVVLAETERSAERARVSAGSCDAYVVEPDEEKRGAIAALAVHLLAA